MITNKWINGTEGAAEAFALRRAVFVEEMGIAWQEDPDPLDAQAIQLIIYDGDEAVATGRVYHDGRSFRIGRLAVRRDSRGQGIGDLLVKLLLLKAFEFNPSRVRAYASPEARGFYERYGFYIEAGDGGATAGGFGGMGGVEPPPHIPMEVTKDTLVFKSKCGHDKTYWDFFEEGNAARAAAEKEAE